MAKKVLIFNNEVVDIHDASFEVHSSFTWMDCDDDSVSRDWTLVDGVLTKPDGSITSDDWAKLRSSRDVRLGRCDWTQVADNKLSDTKKAEWQTYRQSLRDLPANITDPRSPSWPTQPS